MHVIFDTAITNAVLSVDKIDKNVLVKMASNVQYAVDGIPISVVPYLGGFRRHLVNSHGILIKQCFGLTSQNA